MLAVTDWLAAIATIVVGIAQLGATAMTALAERLLTMGLAAVIILGVAGFVATRFRAFIVPRRLSWPHTQGGAWSRGSSAGRGYILPQAGLLAYHFGHIRACAQRRKISPTT